MFLNYFPTNNEEISLIKFIAMFQYLAVNDTKYFFTSKKYYMKRISNLIEKKYIKKAKSVLYLGELGIEYCKLFKFEYVPRNRNKKYLPRLHYISHLGVFYKESNDVQFTPSYIIKDKEIFTTTARKFIGKLNINGFEYLTYRISSEHDNRYITSVIYDIQKEQKYRNIIVFIDDITRINMQDFAFGYNQVLVIEDTEENKQKLKFINSINWANVVYDVYKNKVYLAEYNFCDYTDRKDKYISLFGSFIDTEKINRIKYFLVANKNKRADILCPKDLKEIIQKEILGANITCIELEKYTDKERKYYD